MKQQEPKLSERSLRFIENYKKIFDESDEPTYKIGEQFGLNGSYAYKLVKKYVAPALGLPYESLIRSPKAFYERDVKANTRKTPVISNETEQGFIALKTKLGKLIEEVVRERKE